MASLRSYRAGAGALVLGLLLLVAPRLAHAQSDGPLDVSVDRARIELTDTLQLSIRTTTEGLGRAGSLESPSLADWQIVGQLERNSIDGARGVQQRLIQLSLQPRKAGPIVIAPFVLKTDNGEYRSEPITITVGPSGNSADGSSGGTATPEAPDRIAFLRWETPQTELWLGEQTEAELVLYYNRQVRLTDATPPDVNLEGFWTLDRQGREDRRLIQMGDEMFVRQPLGLWQLVPIKAGDLTLPAAPMQLTVTQAIGLRRSNQRIERAAAGQTIRVKALPEAGRPVRFKGPAVGALTLEAATDRSQVKASEGVQLTVTTQVEGMLQNVPSIELPDLPDFRVYPPSDVEQSAVRNGKLRGVRRQTWLLRPTRDGDLTIPALALPYFDPASGQYAIARTRPLNIRATGATDPGAQGAISVEARPAGNDPAALPLRDIRAQVADGGGLRAPYAAAWFVAIAFGAPLLFLGVVVRDRLQARRHQNAGSRAARKAAGQARSQLDRVARAGGDQAYGEIARILLNYLEARLARAVRGLTHQDLGASLVAQGVDEATVSNLIAELEHCDFARFAPVAGAGEVEQSVARARQIVDGIEGGLR
ncbi:MAG: protein BatD [Myxococcales bacterium]|nr:protein BatD [Myxococcales bacterium]